MKVTHSFVSTAPPKPGRISSAEWNAEHVIEDIEMPSGFGIDGGAAESTYQADQLIDGGGASGN